MTSGQDEAKKDEYEEDDADVKQVTKVLVGRDAKSRVCTAIPVPQKGVDQDKWAVREGLRFLQLLGYTSVVLKSDQESALGVVLKRLKTHSNSDNDRTQSSGRVKVQWVRENHSKRRGADKDTQKCN